MEDENELNLQSYISIRIDKVVQEVCDNLCKYCQTIDDDFTCDYMREHGGKCPLDKLLM